MEKPQQDAEPQVSPEVTRAQKLALAVIAQVNEDMDEYDAMLRMPLPPIYDPTIN